MSRESQWRAQHPGCELPCYLRDPIHHNGGYGNDTTYSVGSNAAKRAARARIYKGPAKTPKGLKGK